MKRVRSSKPEKGTRVYHHRQGKGTVAPYLSREFTPTKWFESGCRVAFDDGGGVRWMDIKHLTIIPNTPEDPVQWWQKEDTEPRTIANDLPEWSD